MCGVVGVHAPGRDPRDLARAALVALQHRGQESAGIATLLGRQVRIESDTGLVSHALSARAEQPGGRWAIGHTRYSTSGSTGAANAQPFPVVHPRLGPAALAYNGNAVNAAAVRRDLERRGARFVTDVDTEVLVRLLERADGDDWPTVLAAAFAGIAGAYSCLLLTATGVLATRDPHGFRPLCLGRLPGDGWVVASESCALGPIGARLVREVAPGETVELDQAGCRTVHWAPAEPSSLCMFELVYFARPDSLLSGCEVGGARMRMGEELAREAPAPADCVSGVPDSGVMAAVAYAASMDLPYVPALVRNPHLGRTFLHPEPSSREQQVRMKLSVLPRSLRGRRVVLLDDSLVRGTTAQVAVRLLREAGATEVHVRIASPAVTHPCFMGVDIATRRELVAAGQPVSAVAAEIGADSLAYLSLAGLRRAAMPATADGLCSACFDGRYPVRVDGNGTLERVLDADRFRAAS